MLGADPGEHQTAHHVPPGIAGPLSGIRFGAYTKRLSPCTRWTTVSRFRVQRRSLRRPMGTKDTGAWLNWVLVVVIAVSGFAAAGIVIVNSSATKAISVQAERSLLISDMQHAVQVESEAAAVFVAHLPVNPDNAHDMTDMESEGSVHSDEIAPTNLSDHVLVRDASVEFTMAAETALAMASSPGDAQQIRAALESHHVFVDSLVALNQAAHVGTDAMSLYHGDTRLAEAALLDNVQQLRSETIADLAEAVNRSEWSLAMLAVILPIAAVGAMIAAVWLIRSRRARRRVKFLEHVIAEKERFIGTVSHELRTPLAAIVGFTELLASGDAELSDAEQREYLSLILTQGNEVSGIVDDLLVAARVEIGELALVRVPVDLPAQARQVVEALDFPGGKPVVPVASAFGLGDPGRVRQIVRNLLTNAIRYGGPSITIDFEVGGETATLRVVDDGDPIAIEDRSRIFEPYTTLSESQPVTGSIGLGLTVSRQLARLMDGDLIYERGENENVFTLTIPISSGHRHLQEPRQIRSVSV